MSQRLVMIFLLGLALGAGLSWMLHPESPAGKHNATPTPDGPRASETAQLRADLARERGWRDELEAEITSLEDRLATARGEIEFAFENGPGGLDSSETDSELDSKSDGPPRPITNMEEDDSERFDNEALERLGYPEHEIERIHNLWDDYAMERITRLDETKRGLRLTPHYAEMRRELREDLGEDGYDAMLYATGQANRVRVSRVLRSSPAARGGLQEGDVVLSYDGERVFKPMMLRALTGQGPRGELVDVRVRRDGEVERLFIPRGTLGATTVSAIEAPQVKF